ncbi:MAG: phospholipid carrier-dependent glycosyltransferase [Deltaproteobacteria bacterium]|nr:phospholipid carrier-dependent glycosyltransferase [Deltaproteobacteria bacterium]
MPINKSRIINNLLETIICITILILLSIECILNLTPPIARDALIHHLAIPKLWLNNGGFYEMKWADFSYFPMNVDLLYMIPIYFNKDFIANFIHMSFGIGTALLIYYYLNNRLSRIAGLLGIFVFLSTPIVVRMSTQAYVDLGLTFFTTASIISFIRYRDGGFKEFKWLFFSSVAMGLALGTKYNALIVFFFLSLAIVFVYSRDTKKQYKAIGHGAIFFLISLLVFSPWLIKNIILTGNPLYPLFKGSVYSIVSADTNIGFFKMRELLYGDNFWETLLIPIRIFFQGQDNSSRYFDGVLNPVLIILSPFALMNKSFYRDKIFFISFAVFFILTVFFLEQKAFSVDQIVRYILPVIPLLSILTVMGLINIWNWAMNRSILSRNILVVVILVFFTLILSKNIFYIKNYYQNINPLNYISGKESRDEFIARHNSSYPAIKYTNTHTPANARIRLVFLAGRGYYLDRIYDEGASYGIGDVRGLAENSHGDRLFQAYLHSLGCTHLLVRTDLFLKYLQDNYTKETTNRLFQQMKKSTEIIYNANGYAVYRLI